MDFVLNILLGILFEIIFITLMTIKVKDIKDKKIKLFFSVLTTYFLSGILINFTYNNQYIFYILFNIICFMFMKILYKEKVDIIDLFLIYFIEMILNFTSLICMKVLDYNYYSMILNRFVLILIYYLPLRFNNIYIKIKRNWNRHRNNKIKSITLRNLIIITCNLSMYVIYYFLTNYLVKIVNMLIMKNINYAFIKWLMVKS